MKDATGLPLPAASAFTKTLGVAEENLRAILATGSKRVKIPPQVRGKMTGFKQVWDWWSSAAGQKAYAALLDEIAKAAEAKPKTRSAGG